MTGTQVPHNSVWSSMNYVPPRGPCNFKNGIMSGTCSCLRFMLHPVKAATSFECDGCGHHASYHSMENKADDAIIQRWSEQENILASASDAAAAAATTTTGASKKRRRIAAKPHNEGIAVMDLSIDDYATSRTASEAPSSVFRTARVSRQNGSVGQK